MQTTEQQKRINIDALIQNANRAESYMELLPHLTWRKTGRNYRAKESSGLSIYRDRSGQWLLKNHSGKLDIPSGNVWTLVKNLYKIDTSTGEGVRQCAQIVASVSGQTLSIQNELVEYKKPLIPTYKKEKFVPNNAYELRSTYTASFTNYHSNTAQPTIQYFARFGVTVETLEKYAVKPLKWTAYGNNSKRNIYTSKDYAFAYVIGNDKNIKYKRPNAPKREKERYIQSSGNHVFGYNQLPSIDERKDYKLLICAGEKDCLVLNQHLRKDGFYAICFNSEKTSIDKDFLQSLRDQFKAVYTIFDNDKTGRNSMRKNLKEHHIPYIDIAAYVNTDGKINEKLNDVADIVEFEGVERLRSIISYEISKEPIVLKGNKRTIIHAKATERLNEVLKDKQVLGSRVVAPTGMGKTFWLASLKGVKVIACPTVALCQNVVQEYNAYEFRRSTQQIDFISNVKKASSLPSLIATTYASLPKLTELLEEHCKNTDLAFDEEQECTSSTSKGFRGKELNDILKIVDNYRSFTTLTGTQLNTTHPRLLEMPIVDVRKERQKKECVFVNAANTLRTTAKLIDKSIKAGRIPLVLFNRKKEEGQLGTLKSLIKSDGITYLSANSKDETDFQHLIQNSLLPKFSKGIVSTCVLKTGTNINDEKDFDIIIVGNFHPSDIEQFANRPRHPESIKIYVVRSAERETSDSLFDWHAVANRQVKKTQQAVDELNTPCAMDGEQYEREYAVRNAIQFLPIEYCGQSQKYVINHLMLSNQVHQWETSALNKNDELMKAYLSKYDIEVVDTISSEVIITKDEKEAAKKIRLQAKAKTQKQYFDAVDRLENSNDPLSEIEEQLTINCKTLSEIQIKACERYKALSEFYTDKKDITTVMRSLDTSRSKFSRHLKQLQVQRVREDVQYMNTNRKLPILIKAIDNSFKEGEVLSGEQIRERLLKVLKIDKSIDLYPFKQKRNSKALNVLRMFWGAHKITVRENDKIASKYRIVTLFSDVPLNTNYKNKVTTLNDKVDTSKYSYPKCWDTLEV